MCAFAEKDSREKTAKQVRNFFVIFYKALEKVFNKLVLY